MNTTFVSFSFPNQKRPPLIKETCKLCWCCANRFNASPHPLSGTLCNEPSASQNTFACRFKTPARLIGSYLHARLKRAPCCICAASQQAECSWTKTASMAQRQKPLRRAPSSNRFAMMTHRDRGLRTPKHFRDGSDAMDTEKVKQSGKEGTVTVKVAFTLCTRTPCTDGLRTPNGL